MIEDQLWNDAISMQKKRNTAYAKLKELAEWAGWDIQNGPAFLVYSTLKQRIRVSTDDEIDELLEDMQSRINMLMLKKLGQAIK